MTKGSNRRSQRNATQHEPTAGNAVLAPESGAGQVLVWLGLTALIVVLGLGTQSAKDPIDTVVTGLVLTFPAVILAARGHFGRCRWEVPTAGGFVFVFWQLGLTPSMCAVAEDARRVCVFDDVAVMWGRGIHFLWFFFFALVLGEATRGHPRFTHRPNAHGLFGLQLFLMFGYWALGAFAAFQSNSLSLWAGEGYREREGLLPALTLLYNSLTPLLPPLGLLARARGGQLARRLGWPMVALGVFFLFVLSSRRHWIVSAFLCLTLAQARARQLPLKFLGALGVLTAIAMGPLLWSFRSTASDHHAGTPFERVAGAVGALVADDSATRGRSLVTSRDNLTVRLKIATITYGNVQLVIDRGPRLAGTIFSGLVRSVPKVFWNEKNRLADSLDARNQMLRTGRFPLTDIPVSPITELTYDLGLFLAPLGGLLYGAIARLCDRSAARARETLHGFVAWSAIVSAISIFDGGAFILFLGGREAFAVASTLWLFARAFEVRQHTQARVSAG